MRSWSYSWGWTSLALLPVLAAGCGGTPDAPQANGNNGAATNPEAPVERVADAPPPVERTPEPAAADTLRKFLYAIVERDQATLQSISLPHPDLSLLWVGEKPEAEYLADAKKEIDSIAFSKLLPGDKMIDLSGAEMTIKATDVKEGQLLVTFNENPIPFFLEKQAGTWRIHPAPIIASRKAAIAEMQAAEVDAQKGTPEQPPVQQPAVQTADQLGSGVGTRPAELKR